MGVCVCGTWVCLPKCATQPSFIGPSVPLGVDEEGGNMFCFASCHAPPFSCLSVDNLALICIARIFPLSVSFQTFLLDVTLSVSNQLSMCAYVSMLVCVCVCVIYTHKSLATSKLQFQRLTLDT